MIFNSVTYLLFLFFAVVLFYTLPKKARLWMLFIFSVTFYGFWRFDFVPIMLLSAVIDYWVSKKIYTTPTEDKKKRKQLLYISLAVNLGLLFIFKYLYFFTDSANGLLSLFTDAQLPLFKVVLPLGISFYTFQTISYTVDVYRGFRKPLNDFVLYSGYVMFFPQLVAGPILRADEVIEQLDAKPAFKLENFNEGFKRLLQGLFLKTVLADNIATHVDTGFAADIPNMGALDVWTLAFLFGFQIYFDFAAYSHIAIGSAKMMGIHFPENFNFPYVAKSFKDFWKRWHISLSSWIRDYLYLPLAGIQVKNVGSQGGIGEEVTQTKKNTALFATWAIMGLWHGANWTFIFWGVYHSILIFIERFVKKFTDNIPIPGFLKTAGGRVVTLMFAMLGWIPFRAETIGDTLTMFGKVFNPMTYMHMSLRENTYLITATVMGLHLLAHFFTQKVGPQIAKYPALKVVVNGSMYTVMFILVFTFLRPISQFIYFQF